MQHVTRYQMSRDERDYDPVVGRFRDKDRERAYIHQERSTLKNAIKEAKDMSLNYSQTFNIVNHDSSLAKRKGDKGELLHTTLSNKVPDTRVAYNILSNKTLGGHHHKPPQNRPKADLDEHAHSKKAHAPTSQVLDFDIISNKYQSDHEKKDVLDQEAQKMLAGEKFWGTHNYNAIEGTFYDNQKEEHFQEMLKHKESVQGIAQANRQPHSNKYCEGALYDIVSNATRNKKKMKEVATIGNRALNNKKGRQVEDDVHTRSTLQDKLVFDRTMNRVANQRMEEATKHGYNAVTNQAYGHGRLAEQPSQHPRVNPNKAHASAFERSEVGTRQRASTANATATFGRKTKEAAQNSGQGRLRTSSARTAGASVVAGGAGGGGRSSQGRTPAVPGLHIPSARSEQTYRSNNASQISFGQQSNY